MNSISRYDRATRYLHWLQAALIVIVIVLGEWMVGLNYYDRWYYDSIFWHRALGMLTLAVFAVQFCWRLLRTSPAPLVTGWEKIAATVTHGVFFALMLTMPVTGYLISTSAGDGIPLPAGLEIPALITVTDSVRDFAAATHHNLAHAFIVLIVIHLVAALKHHFFDRSDVLRRML